MKLKWAMVNRDVFTAEHEDYQILVDGVKWYIVKKGQTKYVDCCFYHPNIATGELQAKVQAEKALDNVLYITQP